MHKQTAKENHWAWFFVLVTLKYTNADRKESRNYAGSIINASFLESTSSIFWISLPKIAVRYQREVEWIVEKLLKGERTL